MPPPSFTAKLTLVHDRDRPDLCEDATIKDRFPALVAQRDEQYSIEDLYVRFAPYVARIASKILGREGEVQDVVQDVFTAAVGGLRTRREVHQVKGWLAKVAVRISMRKLRARSFWRLFDLDEAPRYDRIADPAAGPFEAQLVSEVYAALDRAAARDRVAWVLRYVEGESLEAVAELCECSLATVKRRIQKAHQLVQEHVRVEPHSRSGEGGDRVF